MFILKQNISIRHVIRCARMPVCARAIAPQCRMNTITIAPVICERTLYGGTMDRNELMLQRTISELVRRGQGGDCTMFPSW